MVRKGSSNRLFMLLGLLAVLAVVIVLVLDPFGFKAGGEQQDAEADPQSVLAGFAADDITAMSIRQPDSEEFRLVLNGEKWFATTNEEGRLHKANMDRIQKILDEVPGVKQTSLASDKADKHSTFEVDESQSIRFRVFTGGDTAALDLHVGKATDGFQGAFVRKDGSDEVWRAGANIKSLVGFSFADFRSKTPWDYEPALVESISVRAPGPDSPLHTFTLKDGFWQQADGTNGNQNEINTLIDELAKFSINSFEDEPDEETLAALEGRSPNIIVSTPEGEYNLTLSDEMESNYFFSDADTNVYKSTAYSLRFYTDLEFDKLTFEEGAGDDAESADGADESENKNSDE